MSIPQLNFFSMVRKFKMEYVHNIALGFVDFMFSGVKFTSSGEWNLGNEK